MNKAILKPEKVCLDQSNFAKAMLAGETSLRQFFDEQLVDENTPKHISALKNVFFQKAGSGECVDLISIADNRYEGGRHRAAASLSNAIWPNATDPLTNVAKDRIAIATIDDVLLQWTGESNSTEFTSRIKILTGQATDQQLGIYQLTVELFPVLEQGEEGCLFPNLLIHGATQFDEKWWAAFDSAWKFAGLQSRFSGRWSVTNVDDIELNSATRPYAPLFSGPSAQAAVLIAILAASGDPYREGTSENGWALSEGKAPTQPEQIDESVAISAKVLDELDQDATKTAPNAPRVLRQKLEDIGYKSEKLGAAIQYGLQSVYFAAKKKTNSQSKDTDSADKAPDPRIEVLRIGSVVEALDGVLLTNRYLKKYQEAIEKEWLRPWKEGTADFKTMKLAGQKAKDRSED